MLTTDLRHALRLFRREPAFCAAAVITLALSGPAHATASGCAVVLRTPDGFLNVRAGPSMKAPVVGKFRPGDLIGIDSTECGRVQGREVCKSKEWTFTARR